jgi:hypothetical protein
MDVMKRSYVYSPLILFYLPRGLIMTETVNPQSSVTNHLRVYLDNTAETAVHYDGCYGILGTKGELVIMDSRNTKYPVAIIANGRWTRYENHGHLESKETYPTPSNSSPRQLPPSAPEVLREWVPPYAKNIPLTEKDIPARGLDTTRTEVQARVGAFKRVVGPFPLLSSIRFPKLSFAGKKRQPPRRARNRTGLLGGLASIAMLAISASMPHH